MEYINEKKIETTIYTNLPCAMRVLILLALISAAYAAPDLKIRPYLARTVSRIYGGNDTTIQTYPYMSNMMYNFGDIFWYPVSGGSLITPSTILSTASWYYRYNSPSQWRVRFGSTNVGTGGSVYMVLNIHIHEDYDDYTSYNDVAIVRLTTRVTLSDTVGLARIAGPNYHLSDGTQVTVIGWGNVGNFTYPERLQHVNINIINQELCVERYAYLKTYPGLQHMPDVTDGMLCAGILNLGGKDWCDGDIGAPLVHQGDILVGAASWGYECGHYFYPGVYARVSYFSDWIVANGAG